MSKTVFIAALLMSLLVRSAAVEQRADYVNERTAGERKLWLSWTARERERYLFGYLKGYAAGFGSGCRNYFDKNPPHVITGLEDSPLQHCMLQKLQYSKSLHQYEGKITAYYQTYDTDEDISITWLLQAFSDSETKTSEEIHEAWSRGHSHP